MKAGDTVMYVDLSGKPMYPYTPMIIERIDGAYYSFKFKFKDKKYFATAKKKQGWINDFTDWFFITKEITNKNFLKYCD